MDPRVDVLEAKIDALSVKVDERGGAERFERMQRTMFRSSVVVVMGLLGIIATQL